MEFEILPLNMSVASVWLLTPDYRGLRHHLEERGYTVKGPEVERRPDLVATKGTIEVHSNAERRTLGVRGQTSTKDLIDAYMELMNINFDILGVDTANIIFHEFLGDFTVSTGADPMHVLATANKEVKVIHRIGEIFGIQASASAIRVVSVSKGSSPTSAKWFNMTIEPLYVSFHKRYHISIVHRDTISDPLVEMLKHLETRLKQVIKVVEQEAGS